MMKLLFATLALATLIGSAPVQAQSELDHRVQRAWDDVFNPPPPGDPRTNWERRRDQDRYRRANPARYASWCRAHPRMASCDRYYGRN